MEGSVGAILVLIGRVSDESAGTNHTDGYQGWTIGVYDSNYVSDWQTSP